VGGVVGHATGRGSLCRSLVSQAVVEASVHGTRNVSCEPNVCGRRFSK
jgi:hypothetical protein